MLLTTSSSQTETIPVFLLNNMEYSINSYYWLVADLDTNQEQQLTSHIKAQDYFGTLATVLNLIHEPHTDTTQEIIDELTYLQDNYEIKKK